MMVLKNILMPLTWSNMKYLNICGQGMLTLPFGFYKDYTRLSSGLPAFKLAGLIYILYITNSTQSILDIYNANL